MTARAGLALALALGLLLPAAAAAQPAERVRVIGYLDQGTAAASRRYVQAFTDGLRDLGWQPGRNVALETRFADGDADRLPALADDLVRRKVDVIVTSTTPAALAAKRATTTIPIVIGFAADPVGSGIVASLAHPGANVTGWSHVGLELRAKYLELLKDAVPRATRIGVLWNPANQVHRPSLKVLEGGAQQMRIELALVGVQDAAALETAFATLTARHVDGLVVFPDGMFLANAPAIIALAARHRLPAIYGITDLAEAGGLMAYGVDFSRMYRRGAAFVDKIFRGARPGDLPVEQPTKFDFVINVGTARTLGLTLPPSLLVRADRVIP